MIDLKQAFEECSDDFVQFERVKNPLNPRPDICAFLMLDSILPPEPNVNGCILDMICYATHDEITLSVDVEKLAAVITAEQVIDLARCGIRYDNDCLCMFV